MNPGRRVALLVEDHPLTRVLLVSALEDIGFLVTGADSFRRAVTIFQRLDPDLLIADVDLGSRPNGLELAALLSTQSPGLGLVIISNYPQLSQVPGYHSLPSGARFISKLDIDDSDKLRRVIESAFRESPEGPPPNLKLSENPLARLTSIQLDVLRMVAEGWSNHEIAKRRGTHTGSIEKILTRIFKALDIDDSTAVNPRVAATRQYIRTFGPPEPDLP